MIEVWVRVYPGAEVEVYRVWGPVFRFPRFRFRSRAMVAHIRYVFMIVFVSHAVQP